MKSSFLIGPKKEVKKFDLADILGKALLEVT
jgi:hypothetical protein